jgi:hypothetical protein
MHGFPAFDAFVHLAQARMVATVRGPHDVVLSLIQHAHIGDRRVGKWHEHFDAPVRAELSRVFAPFLVRFGYATG